MAMRYGYFDSEIIGVDSEGMPIFDRAETSELFRLLFAKLLTNGVLALPGDCFQVVAGSSGLTVKIRPGFGLINGAFAYDGVEETYALATAPTQYSRIDRVVLRCNYLERLCEIIVKTGTPAANPVPPELLQPSSGDYYELGLALINIGANQSVITQSSITDTRADSSVCGFITQLIDHLDTEVFYDQFNAFYAEFVEKSGASYKEFLQNSQDTFSDWFDNLQNQLDDNQVTNLQNQITKLNGDVEVAQTDISGLETSVDQHENDLYSLAVPTVGGGTLVYDGNEQSPAWDGYYPNAMAIGGDVSKTAAGSYAATFTPKGNYHWADGTQTAKSVAWEISVKIVSVPRAANRLTESSTPKAPTWIGYDPKIMSLSQELHRDVGNYSTVFTLTDNSCAWPPNYASGRQVTVRWRIYPMELHQDGDSYYRQWVSGTGNTITEWLNPPMQVGVEYRTNERYLGQPVYTKLLDLGLAANNKQVALPGIYAIRHAGTLRYHTMPYGVKDDLYFAISYIWSDGIILQCSDAFASNNFPWQEQIWYVKTLPVG